MMRSRLEEAVGARSNVPRRDFIRGLGLGAAGWGLSAGAAFGEDLATPENSSSLLPDDDDADIAGCSYALWSTSRRAFTQSVNVTRCDPCNCPPHGQINFVLKQRMTTSFEVLSFCDELGVIGFPTAARLEWNITKKEVRVIGPCQTPIGSFAGKFTVTDIPGNPLVSGKLSGVLGYEPCTSTNPCCAFPRVAGMMTGRGVRGTNFENCIVRWTFCGVEEAVPSNPCQIILWDVRIHGIMRCAC